MRFFSSKNFWCYASCTACTGILILYCYIDFEITDKEYEFDKMSYP